MDRNGRNGWKWQEIYKNFWNDWKLKEMTGMAEKSGTFWKGREWLDMA